MIEVLIRHKVRFDSSWIPMNNSKLSIESKRAGFVSRLVSFIRIPPGLKLPPFPILQRRLMMWSTSSRTGPRIAGRHSGFRIEDGEASEVTLRITESRNLIDFPVFPMVDHPEESNNADCV